ncbi:hypothetical protein N658DRAFT_307088 [Parathielavia hyrcaniae]|uniref:NACHT-NTPase and P-loop NTPases N-terminal domain-containing protein n=1 Tax=Parathielavia hyrcaniae TaxID=113614 RepID=A0AAN6Q4A5_9PEZI|nr:hypothetical protein N658DRAFT_307088 [Parathielavia hyrcaniae]
MAEVLGVVASGIAVTQAAQSLGGLVISLTRLWKEVRDVPDTIRHILEDLEVCGNLVDVVETELQLYEPSAPSNGASSAALTSLHRLAIQRCRQAQKNLGDLFEDLRADIASSRRRKRLAAEIRVVLKRDVLEGYERRLQRPCGFWTRLFRCRWRLPKL